MELNYYYFLLKAFLLFILNPVHTLYFFKIKNKKSIQQV